MRGTELSQRPAPIASLTGLSFATGFFLVFLLAGGTVIASLGPCFRTISYGSEGIGTGLVVVVAAALGVVVVVAVAVVGLLLTGHRLGALLVVGFVTGIAVGFVAVGQFLQWRSQQYSEVACMATQPSPEPTPPNVRASLELRLTAPVARTYQGSGLCEIDDSATGVKVIRASTPDQRPFAEFRDGDTVVRELEIRPLAEPLGAIAVLVVLIDQDSHTEATYRATLGRPGPGPGTATTWSGDVIFSQLEGRAISGSITWTCLPNT